MKTRILILLMTLILSGGISQAESAYSKLVEPGRTWWYWSWMSAEGGSEKVILGLTIDRPDSEGWSPCYALDSLNQKVVDVPLCHLREENRRVEIRPNLHLPVPDYQDRTNEQFILSLFLGYWYGDYYRFTIWDGEDTHITWNPEGLTQFLLYDFNYDVGDCYDWPWSGVSTDFSPYWEQNECLKGAPKIMAIQEETVHTGLSEKKTVKTYTLKQYEKSWSSGEWSYTGNIKIQEGLGITRNGSWNIVASYVEDMITWSGFFIAPMSICMVAVSGLRSPEIPVLHSVIDSDGTCLYIDPEFLKNSGIENGIVSEFPSDTNLPLYDLHGCRVSNPIPGSVYIRGGKKYIVR
ncbi:MAG: hypothetical protein K2J70_05415 [Muribaculaceae bacterium]|nr:hypothetical protein [Muribaculaceae bacterium]MDE6717617.1 hypothetical protein [Muribaculaceae bacterium]